MIKKIVVPLDGSEEAEKAISVASDIAETYGSELLFIRVCELPADSGDYEGPAYEELRVECEKITQGYLDRVKDSVSNEIDAKTKLVFGHSVEALLVHVEDYKADLVVMTSQGKSSLERWLLGSTVENFARRAACPVLVTRSGKAVVLPLGRKILVALDGSEVAEKVLPMASEMAIRAQGELLLFRSHPCHSEGSYEFDSHDLYPDVSNKGDGSGEELAKKYLETTRTSVRSSAPDLKVSTLLSFKLPAEAILSAAEEEEVDLIALTSHGATGMGKWMFGSVAEKVLRYAKSPILVIRSE